MYLRSKNKVTSTFFFGNSEVGTTFVTVQNLETILNCIL